MFFGIKFILPSRGHSRVSRP